MSGYLYEYKHNYETNADCPGGDGLGVASTGTCRGGGHLLAFQEWQGRRVTVSQHA